MTSVERVMEYTELENEAAWETQKPPPGWPNKGLITFDQVNFSYSAKGPPVLKNLTAMFKPKKGKEEEEGCALCLTRYKRNKDFPFPQSRAV